MSCLLRLERRLVRRIQCEQHEARMWLHCAMLTADYDERQECMRKARGPLWLQALARAYPAYEKIGNSRKDKR